MTAWMRKIERKWKTTEEEADKMSKGEEEEKKWKNQKREKEEEISDLD